MPKSQGRTSLAYLEPRKPWGWSWWETERGSEREASALWTLVKYLETLRAFPAGERHNLTYRISGARAEARSSVGRLLTWATQLVVAQTQRRAERGMRGSGCWCASSFVHTQLDKRVSNDLRLLGEKDHGIYLFQKGSRLLGGLRSQGRMHIFSP